MEQNTVTLGTVPPSVYSIACVARTNAKLVVTDEGWSKVRAARTVVEKHAREKQPVYGLNTGLGASVDTALEDSEMLAFQQRVPHSHSVGVGPTLSKEAVRAMMVTRVACMVAGGSGVSELVVRAIVAALNAGVHPVIPEWGSIGAADLAPLAHMSLGLMGVGKAEYNGEVMLASHALAKAGLKPMELGIKDGHALVVANSLAVGSACLGLEDAYSIMEWSLKSVCLNYEAFRANTNILSEASLKARPAFGQVQVGSMLRDLLSGSSLWQKGAARRLQDPLSYRCVPQVWGGMLHAMEEAREASEIELNCSGDNPVVVIASNEIIPTANFDMTAFTLSWERLGQAIAHCATGTAHRCMKIMSPSVSDLPRFLSSRGQHYGGYAVLQKSISALEAEIRHHALPISISPMPVSDNIEDQSSMAPRVVAKTHEILKKYKILVAIELLLCSEAVELRGVVDSLGVGAKEAYQKVRSLVARPDGDIEIGTPVMQIATLMSCEQR